MRRFNCIAPRKMSRASTFSAQWISGFKLLLTSICDQFSGKKVAQPPHLPKKRLLDKMLYFKWYFLWETKRYFKFQLFIYLMITTGVASTTASSNNISQIIIVVIKATQMLKRKNTIPTGSQVFQINSIILHQTL